MKAPVLALVLSLVPLAWAGETSSSRPETKPADPYRAFLAQLFTREGLGQYTAACDGLIDKVDPPEMQAQTLGPLVGETKQGLHLEFGCVSAEQATLYYASVSRKGEPLRYSDAVRLISLFADRAGLPHPITIKEGERPVFFAEWIFNPSTWKKERTLMLKYRGENRAIKDPAQAFAVAVERELKARQTTPKD